MLPAVLSKATGTAQTDPLRLRLFLGGLGRLRGLGGSDASVVGSGVVVLDLNSRITSGVRMPYFGHRRSRLIDLFLACRCPANRPPARRLQVHRPWPELTAMPRSGSKEGISGATAPDRSNNTLVNAMPLAFGQATVGPVTWLWLTGSGVLLFTFIVTLLNVPPTLAANWQLVRAAVRRVQRPKRPASAVAGVPKDEATEARALTPCLPPSPRVMLRPDYRYNGGAVSTSAVMDVGSYMQYVITQPDSGHLPPLSALFRSGPTGAGTAATR